MHWLENLFFISCGYQAQHNISKNIGQYQGLVCSSGVVWQTRDLHLSHNTLCLLSPRLSFFIALKRDLFVNREESSTS